LAHPLIHGIALYRQKKYNQALVSFSKLSSARALYNQANTLVQLKRYKEALSRYQKAINLQPDYSDAILNHKLISSILNKTSQKVTKLQNNIPKNNQKQKQAKKKKLLSLPKVAKNSEELMDGPKKSDFKKGLSKKKHKLESIGSLSGAAIMIQDKGKDKNKEGSSIGQGLSKGTEDLRKQDKIARETKKSSSSVQKYSAKKVVSNKQLSENSKIVKKDKKPSKINNTTKNSNKKKAQQLHTGKSKPQLSNAKNTNMPIKNNPNKQLKGGSESSQQLSKKEKNRLYEQKKFLQHWLKSIEDNPQELLKEVFKREFQSYLKNKPIIRKTNLNIEDKPW